MTASKLSGLLGDLNFMQSITSKYLTLPPFACGARRSQGICSKHTCLDQAQDTFAASDERNLASEPLSWQNKPIFRSLTGLREDVVADGRAR